MRSGPGRPPGPDHAPYGPRILSGGASPPEPAPHSPSPRPGPNRTHQEPETVPAHLADTGGHDALLDAHGGWEKWRTWSYETTQAMHESQTLRIKRVHETPRMKQHGPWPPARHPSPTACHPAAGTAHSVPRAPVPVRVLTTTGATPAPVMEELLHHLTDGAATAGTRRSAPLWTRRWPSRPRSPSPTPDGSTPWTGDGSPGRLSTEMRASSSTPSPLMVGRPEPVRRIGRALAMTDAVVDAIGCDL